MRHSTRFTVISLALVAGKVFGAPAEVSVCGVKLGAPLSKAQSSFALHRVGAVMYAGAFGNIQAIRWEGVVKPGQGCVEVRAASGDEPSIVVATTASKPATVIAISHRTPVTDCVEVEREVSSRFGTPSYSTDEAVEWHASANHSVLLARYRGEDCWLSYNARTEAR